MGLNAKPRFYFDVTLCNTERMGHLYKAADLAATTSTQLHDKIARRQIAAAAELRRLSVANPVIPMPSRARQRPFAIAS